MISETEARELMGKLAQTFRDIPLVLKDRLPYNSQELLRTELVQKAIHGGLKGDWTSPETPKQILQWLDGLHVCRLATILGNPRPEAIKLGKYFANQLQRTGVAVDNVFEREEG